MQMTLGFLLVWGLFDIRIANALVSRERPPSYHDIDENGWKIIQPIKLETNAPLKYRI